MNTTQTFRFRADSIEDICTLLNALKAASQHEGVPAEQRPRVIAVHIAPVGVRGEAQPDRVCALTLENVTFVELYGLTSLVKGHRTIRDTLDYEDDNYMWTRIKSGR